MPANSHSQGQSQSKGQSQIESELKRFGANLRRERMAKGLTQERLSELADLNVRTVQKIEAGHINILLTTVIRLQAALGCRWNKLLKEKV